MGLLGRRVPLEQRRAPGVTKWSIMFVFWVEISPYSYFRWRRNQLTDRLERRRARGRRDDGGADPSRADE